MVQHTLGEALQEVKRLSRTLSFTFPNGLLIHTSSKATHIRHIVLFPHLVLLRLWAVVISHRCLL